MKFFIDTAKVEDILRCYDQSVTDREGRKSV